MKRAHLATLLLAALLATSCMTVQPAGPVSTITVTVDTSAKPDRDPIETMGGRENIEWVAGAGVTAVYLKFDPPNAQNPNKPPKPAQAAPGKARIPAAALTNMWKNCKDANNKPVDQCSYKYSITVVNATGGSASVDPVLIIKQPNP